MGLPMWTVPSQAQAKDSATNTDRTAISRSPIRRRRSPEPRRNDIISRNEHMILQAQVAAINRASHEEARRSYTFGTRSPLPPAPSLPLPHPNSRMSPPPEYGTRRNGHISNYLERHRLHTRIARHSPWAEGRYRHAGVRADSLSQGAVNDLPPLTRMSGRRPVVDAPLRSLPQPESGEISTTAEAEFNEAESPQEQRQAEELAANTWANMSFNILPDTIRPSADSSFTSAAASASFTAPRSNDSSSNNSRAPSANSSRTSLTNSHDSTEQDGNDNGSFMHRTIRDAFDRACEEASAHGSDTEADDDDQDEATRQARRLISLASSNSRPQHPDSRRYTRSMRHRSRDANRFVRHYEGYERSRGGSPRSRTSRVASWPERSGIEPSLLDGVLIGLPEQPATSETAISTESSFDTNTSLEHMRRILSRMARDDDIPDEWWASAGLTPTIMSGRHSPVEPLRFGRPSDLRYTSRLPPLRREDAGSS